MARAGGISPAPLAEEALHDPVLEAVECDDGEPPAGLQRPLGRGKAVLELVELGIEMDADCLEGAGRGVALLSLAVTDGTTHDRRKLGFGDQTAAIAHDHLQAICASTKA